MLPGAPPEALGSSVAILIPAPTMDGTGTAVAAGGIGTRRRSAQGAV